LLSILSSNILRLSASHNAIDQVLHPYKPVHKITARCARAAIFTTELYRKNEEPSYEIDEFEVTPCRLVGSGNRTITVVRAQNWQTFRRPDGVRMHDVIP
jgi:hypothetical protein